MPDYRRTRDEQPNGWLDTQALQDWNPREQYSPLDQLGGPAAGGATNDGDLPPHQKELLGQMDQRIASIQQLGQERSALEKQLMASQQEPQGEGFLAGLGRMGSQGLSALGNGLGALIPSQDTLMNGLNRLSAGLEAGGATLQGRTPLYVQLHQAARDNAFKQQQLDMQQDELGMKRMQMAQQLQQQKEVKRGHDLGLLEKALSHPKGSALLEQLANDPSFSLAQQAGMLHKGFKDSDYGSFEAYKEFIPEDVQQRFMEGKLPTHELTAWLDEARVEAKESAKANAKQAILTRAINKPVEQRSPREALLVEEHQAALEVEKLKPRKMQSEIAENEAQAAKYNKEAEGGLIKTSPVINSIAEAFHGVGFNELPQGGKERQDVMNRYSQLYAQGRNAVDLAAPAPVEKRSDVVSRKDFLEKGALNRPPAGVSKGQLATGDYIQMSDMQQKQAKEIEMAKGNLTSMFDLIEPHIKATGPFDAAAQYAKLQAGAASGMNPDVATYKAGSEAFSSVFSRVFGGEVGVMTDRDIARWQATLPTFGDTKATVGKKKELFFKIYDEAVTQFRRSVAGDAVEKKNMQGLLSKAEALKQPESKGEVKSQSPVQIKTKEEYDKLPSGTEYIAPDGKHKRKK